MRKTNFLRTQLGLAFLFTAVLSAQEARSDETAAKQSLAAEVKAAQTVSDQATAQIAFLKDRAAAMRKKQPPQESEAQLYDEGVAAGQVILDRSNARLALEKELLAAPISTADLHARIQKAQGEWQAEENQQIPIEQRRDVWADQLEILAKAKTDFDSESPAITAAKLVRLTGSQAPAKTPAVTASQAEVK